ncbi:MAG: EF-P lysine aminoacylase EpmA [Bdellovibrionaceae bacterium]|nr:EF-P lysine aminoacylase EpmA [Pseudobdellovibrionaceae bacterium]
MNREEFLRSHWKRYPAIDMPTVDCQTALSLPGVVSVGGRLVVAANAFHLVSAGVSLPLDFEQAQWSESGVFALVPAFSPAQIRDGDLLCVRAKSENGVWRVRDVQLLFAAHDPAWRQPPAGPEFRLAWSEASASSWTAMVSAARAYFSAQGFQEARTPTLVPSPGTEPFLDPFRTTVLFGSVSREIFLPTSPEFHLKKLLVGGFTRVFEMKECFRNDEGGSHHQPEFLMLEWYRAYVDLDAIALDVDELIATVARALSLPPPPRLTQTTIRDLFRTYLEFDLKPETAKSELLALARGLGITADAEESWDDVYFRIFLTKLEPELAHGGPWLVRDYPPSQAALARIGRDGWADRFEIYWRGLEIANAFHELNDPELNERRFATDARERAARGKPPVPHDEELVRALYSGLPPSGGIALGMDRLFMALMEIGQIEQTRAFPYRV